MPSSRRDRQAKQRGPSFLRRRWNAYRRARQRGRWPGCRSAARQFPFIARLSATARGHTRRELPSAGDRLSRPRRVGQGLGSGDCVQHSRFCASRGRRGKCTRRGKRRLCWLESRRTCPARGGRFARAGRRFRIFGTPPLAVPAAMDEAFLPNPATPDLFKDDLTDDEIRTRVSACLRPQRADPCEFVDDVRSRTGAFARRSSPALAASATGTKARS